MFVEEVTDRIRQLQYVIGSRPKCVKIVRRMRARPDSLKMS